MLVVKRTDSNISWDDSRDVWYHEAVEKTYTDCPPEEISAEDPLFILYTSDSTGSPKSVLHTTDDYLVWAAMTHETVFDYQPGEVYCCTDDVSWSTGHSHIVYDPLANGATSLMFEGVPSSADPSRFWQVCDKHQVKSFYTAAAPRRYCGH